MLDVYRKPEPGEALAEVPEWRILQEPGSLLVSMGEMYEGCLHGITGVEVDEGLCEVREDADADGRMKKRGAVNWHMLSEECRGRVEENGGRWKRETRLSLTFRDVVRVKSLGKKLGSLAAVGTKY